MLKIEIDPGAGFCFGVEEVIKMAEKRLQEGETIFGLGEMVHNDAETQRLQGLGLKTIDHAQLKDLPSGKVLFRAHGEPPSTFEVAEQHQVEIIDGTCPIVSRLQERLRKAYEEMDTSREQLVIFGKPDHPETIGLVGQVGGDALVVSSPADVLRIDPAKKVRLFSQTTMDPDKFGEVEEAIRSFLKGSGLLDMGDTEVFRSKCTVCGQMKKRKPGLTAFARQHEVILFVSGRNSSNGRMLYEYCRSLNPRTHWISVRSEVKIEWLKDCSSLGISGATSTSRQQLEGVKEEVQNLLSS